MTELRKVAVAPQVAYPVLLWRQWCLLAMLAGAVGYGSIRSMPGLWGSSRYGAAELSALFGDTWLLLPLLGIMTLCSGGTELGHRPRIGVRAVVLALCMMLGGALLYGFEESPAKVPDWITAREVVTIQGTVRSVQTKPQGRLVVLLDSVRCRTVAGWRILSGATVWTWQNPSFVPVAGARMEFAGRVSSVRGFLNMHQWNSGMYWERQGVWYRVWTHADKGHVRMLSSGSTPGEVFKGGEFSLASVRALIQHRLETLLLQAQTSGAGCAVWNTHADEESAQAVAPEKSEGPAPSGRLETQGMAQCYAVLPALLLGNQMHLSAASMDRLAHAGLVHSFALSGMHLGFAVGLGALLAFCMGRVCPRVFLYVPRQKLAVLCAIPFVLLYVWLGGASPSLQRAALMFAFWGALLLLGRRGVLWDGLLWAVVVIVCLQPVAVFDLRLHLSAVAVAGIACVMPFFQRWLNHKGRSTGMNAILRRIMGSAVGILVVSMAAQLVLMPLTLDAFGTVTPWSVLNLLWLPVLGLWLLPLGFLGLAAMSVPALSGLAAWLFAVAAFPAHGLFGMLEYLERAELLFPVLSVRPLPMAGLGFWLLLGGMCLIWRRVGATSRVPETLSTVVCGVGTPALFQGPYIRYWMVPLGVVLLVAPVMLRFTQYLTSETVVSVLDVGQGQAVVVEAPYGVRVLVDGGGFFSSAFDTGKGLVAPVLTRNAPPRLTAVINTHPDRDHLGGLPFILRHFTVGALYTNGSLGTGRDARAVNAAMRVGGPFPVELVAGDIVDLGGNIRLAVVRQRDGRNLNANDNGLVLRLLRGETGLAVLGADLGSATLDGLAAIAGAGQATNFLQAQALVLPHHGSDRSLSTAFYDAVGPNIAVASCGYLNRWGFPGPSVRQALAERNIPLWTTARHGQVRICWDAHDTMRIKTAAVHGTRVHDD